LGRPGHTGEVAPGKYKLEYRRSRHRDRETRLVEVIDGNGWQLQLDNELPVEMKKGGKYTIPEGVYHRTIKGEGSLKIKITFC
jgi:hypothetical protein